jgi:hypothetical protein
VAKLANNGRWAVMAVNDDGRVFIVNGRMCYAAADALAGAMRDQSIEAEIRDGWNYLPRQESPVPQMKRPEARLTIAIGSSKEQKLIANFSTTCTVCGQPIRAGAKCYWLPKHYIRHPVCATPARNAILDGTVGQRLPASDQGNQAQAVGPWRQAPRRETGSPGAGHQRNSRPPGPCRGVAK